MAQRTVRPRAASGPIATWRTAVKAVFQASVSDVATLVELLLKAPSIDINAVTSIGGTGDAAVTNRGQT